MWALHGTKKAGRVILPGSAVWAASGPPVGGEPGYQASNAMKLRWSGSILMFALQLAWAQDPTSACMAGLAQDPALQPLAQKTPLASLKALKLPMLADNSKPDGGDKLLLAQWSEALKHCYTVGQGFREKNVTPASVAILDAQQHAVEALVVRLYAGEMSYGEFNRGRQDIYDQFARQASASAQKMFDTRTAQAQAAQQAALEAQRQAADNGNAEDGNPSGMPPMGPSLMSGGSYPAPASDAVGTVSTDPTGIAAAACARAGLGSACTGK